MSPQATTFWHTIVRPLLDAYHEHTSVAALVSLYDEARRDPSTSPEIVALIEHLIAVRRLLEQL